MTRSNPEVLADRLRRYDRLIEVGIGSRPDLAAALADAGCDVTAIDVADVSVPDGVRFVRDDVVEAADRDGVGSRYRADAVYARRLPPELHRPSRDLARRLGADLLFTTLGTEGPAIPVERKRAGTTTLFVARADDRDPGGT